jgi:hypothetical protein
MSTSSIHEVTFPLKTLEELGALLAGSRGNARIISVFRGT